MTEVTFKNRKLNTEKEGKKDILFYCDVREATIK